MVYMVVALAIVSLTTTRIATTALTATHRNPNHNPNHKRTLNPRYHMAVALVMIGLTAVLVADALEKQSSAFIPLSQVRSYDTFVRSYVHALVPLQQTTKLRSPSITLNHPQPPSTTTQLTTLDHL